MFVYEEILLVEIWKTRVFLCTILQNIVVPLQDRIDKTKLHYYPLLLFLEKSNGRFGGQLHLKQNRPALFNRKKDIKIIYFTRKIQIWVWLEDYELPIIFSHYPCKKTWAHKEIQSYIANFCYSKLVFFI